jgi:hypothetical protein
MSETDTPPTLLSPPGRHPVLPHRNRGSRTVLLVLLLIAVCATLLYLLREPAGRALERLQSATPGASAQATPAPLPAPDAALSNQVAQLRARVTALEQKVAALPAASPPTAAAPAGGDALVAALSARMDGLNTEVAGLAAAARQAGSQTDTLTALAKRVQLLARVAAISAALTQGLPLGDTAGLPPALARFGATPPPTEVQLRLAFPQAAVQARAAARPDGTRRGFWGALRDRAAALITVRRGDTVLIGSGAVETLGRAQAALDAGDLAGALGVLATLPAPAAAAMAEWRAQAQALLDARAALAKLASQA